MQEKIEINTVVVNEELRDLFPALDSTEYQLLEESILKEGCTDPIIVWNGAIVDGYNRYTICQEHGILFETREIAFANLDDAKRWMLTRQMGRRNLTSYHKGELALKYASLFSADARQRQREGGRTKLPQNSDKSAHERETSRKLAKVAGVSHDTMARIKKLSEEADEPTKKKLREGSLSINKAYTGLKARPALCPDGEASCGDEASLPQILGLLEEAVDSFAGMLRSPLSKLTPEMLTPEGRMELERVLNSAGTISMNLFEEKANQLCPSRKDEADLPEGDDLPIGITNANGFIRHTGNTLPDVPESFPVVYQQMQIASENYVASMELALGNYTSGMATKENDEMVGTLVSGVMDTISDMAGDYIIDEIRDCDANANPFTVNPSDLPGLKMIGTHAVHVATHMEDKPESFPMVERLFDSVNKNYLVSLDNTLRQISPGMRTAENDKKVDKAIQYATQGTVRLRDRYLEPGNSEAQRLI